MAMLPITIRKRTIDNADVETIQSTVDRHWDKGRKHISRVLCRQWNWRQPNGRLKDMACREIMLTLNRKGLISLPPPLNNANNHKRNKTIPTTASFTIIIIWGIVRLSAIISSISLISVTARWPAWVGDRQPGR